MPSNDVQEPTPIVLKGGFEDEHWADARKIIKGQLKAVTAEDLPSSSLQEQYEITAAKLYCTAVVENKDEIDKIPKFSAFMQNVRPSRRRRPDKDFQALESSNQEGVG